MPINESWMVIIKNSVTFEAGVINGDDKKIVWPLNCFNSLEILKNPYSLEISISQNKTHHNPCVIW